MSGAFSSVVGIDPGLDGALCLLSARELSVVDMPTLEVRKGKGGKRVIDLPALGQTLAQFGARTDHVFLELATPMPKQSPNSMFTFGMGYGILLGVLATLRLPYSTVSPVVWKRALGLKGGKDGSRERASQLMPAYASHWPLKGHHGRAESALIAWYGLRHGGSA